MLSDSLTSFLFLFIPFARIQFFRSSFSLYVAFAPSYLFSIQLFKDRIDSIVTITGQKMVCFMPHCYCLDTVKIIQRAFFHFNVWHADRLAPWKRSLNSLSIECSAHFTLTVSRCVHTFCGFVENSGWIWKFKKRKKIRKEQTTDWTAINLCMLERWKQKKKKIKMIEMQFSQSANLRGQNTSKMP